MEDSVVVHIPGRIPHRIPQGDAEKFLKDHPQAVVVEAETEAVPKKRRPRAPKSV